MSDNLNILIYFAWPILAFIYNMQNRQIETLASTRACCGCGSCVQRCPQECISLHEDNEGFLYPTINKDACVDCGLCDKVCPVLNKSPRHEPVAVYASISKDEEARLQSSSGGIFSLLAEQVINEGGVVFGARFDEDWMVKLDYTESVDGIAAFRGSKYVQARTGNSFRLAEIFLRQGKKVFFTGTPCQIAGLKRFLRKEYDNLLTADCACYGVPSPKVWRHYLQESIGNHSRQDISSISFRNKTTGWKNYSFTICCNNAPLIRQSRYENAYMRALNLFLRPSCYECRMKGLCSAADLTLADFWGITELSPQMDDDKGTGLVIVHTDKGRKAYPDELIVSEAHSFDEATKKNGGLNSCPVPPPKRTLFFSELDKATNLEELIKRMQARSLLKTLKDKIWWTWHKFYKKME